MNRAFALKLPTVAVFMAAVCISNGQSVNVYAVSEIIHVMSPVSFECRLVNYPEAPQTRFRVSLLDVTGSQRPYAESMAALENALRSAQTIELRDVRTRNYFRIEARVWADGKDVIKELVSKNFIIPVKTEENVTGSEIERVVLRPLRQSSPKISTVVSQSVYPPLSLQQLVRTKVDLSILRAETPFAEALQHISESMHPRLPIVVFWSDLENNAFVDRETPIGVEGFGLISAAMGLDAVLYSVSGYGVPLKFTIDGGILKIGTAASLSQSKKVTRVYSVLDLISPPAYDTSTNGYGSGYSGSGNNRSYSGAR